MLAEHIVWSDLYASLCLLWVKTGLRRGDPTPHVTDSNVCIATIAVRAMSACSYGDLQSNKWT